MRIFNLRAACVGVFLSASLIGCGPGEPGLCEDTRAGALTPWVQETWEPYCDDLFTHLEEPRTISSILKFTEFFAAHPTEREELTKKLASYKEAERCFKSPDDRLRLRRLQACLEDGSSMERRINAAWAARSEPWLDDYQAKIKRLRRDLDDIKRIGDKLNIQLERKFEIQAPYEAKLYDEFAQRLEDTREKVAYVNKLRKKFKRILKIASDNEEFEQMIDSQYSGEVDALIKENEKNQVKYAKMLGDETYFKFAVNSTGKGCPAGLKKSRKEIKAAKSVLKTKLLSLNPRSKKIRITSPSSFEANEKEFHITETIKGFVCGPRKDENQFQGRRKMCAVHKFEIQRIKPKGERRWQPWKVEKFEEGEFDEGVDCNLIDGPPKR